MKALITGGAGDDIISAGNGNNTVSAGAGNNLIVAGDCHPQTIEVIRTRCEPLGLSVKVGFAPGLMQEGDYFAVVAQYPSTSGLIHDLRDVIAQAHAQQAAFIVATDLLALTLLVPPGELGADIVVHSGTKYLDGQGRVVAGALCASEKLVKEVFIPVMRSAGMSLSPFNAWVVLKGMETLGIRMEAQSARALELAKWLEAHPKVARVYYPGLESHPQHALAMKQQRGLGGEGHGAVADRAAIGPRVGGHAADLGGGAFGGGRGFLEGAFGHFGLCGVG